MTRPVVEEAVRERMDRMQSDRVDLLQVRRRFRRPSVVVLLMDDANNTPTDCPIIRACSSTGMTTLIPVT